MDITYFFIGLVSGLAIGAISVWSLLKGTVRKSKGIISNLEDSKNALETELAILTVQANELDTVRQKLDASERDAKALLTEKTKLSAELNSSNSRIQELTSEKGDLRNEHRALQETYTDSVRELESLKASSSEREASFEKQLVNLEENKKALVQEFEVLANKIFDEKGKTFAEQNKQSVNDLLTPFREQLTDFKSRADEIHTKSTEQQAALGQELKQVQQTGLKLSEEAHNLATALRGQKKMQGDWGELILENVLDRSGLVLGTDYRREVVYKNADGTRSRPDVVIDLPQGRHLIIDAKVSLNAYTNYVNAEDETERQSALAEHTKAIKAHIAELSSRDYSSLDGVNSPPIVFMFVPIESAFVEAIKHDDEIYLKSVSDKILVATPTTLLTSLSIVKQLWNFETQNKHARELASHAGKVFNQLRLFLESFTKVQKGLENAMDAYQLSEKRLYTGKGNLIKVVGSFKDMAPAITGSLPDEMVERANLEIEHIAAKDEEQDTIVISNETS